MSVLIRIPSSLVAVTLIVGGLHAAAAAEYGDQAALAKALEGAKTTLEAGLKASEREGKSISAKFEIEDGKLQLSVYTAKGSEFREAVLDPASGTIAKAEKITDADDLKEATAQNAAMAKAKESLLTATEATVKANAGSRAVAIEPALKDGRPVAEVTLVQGGTFRKVSAKLD